MRQWHTVFFCLAIIPSAICVAQDVRADPKAAAEALFQDGTQLLAGGRLEEACPKLAESLKLDPALGTLLYLAACHEKLGLTASAWSEFSSAIEWAERTNQPERAAFGRKHRTQLEATLARVLIHAAPVPGLTLKVDDGLLSSAAVGTALPLDPGRHAIEASAPGTSPWRTTISVPPEATIMTVTVPHLMPTPEHAAPTTKSTTAPEPDEASAASALDSSSSTAPDSSSSTAPDSSSSTAPDSSSSSPPSPTSGPHILLWSAVGLATAGLATGSIFGALTFSARDTARSACPNNVCVPGGLGDIARARSDATVSTVGFGVGLVAGAVAAYLLIRGDGNSKPAATTGERSVSLVPSLSPHRAGIDLLARFE
ncbi:MAG: hypothetical protein ABSC94_20565 [Polyangiaceae bacterium]|jgi:hypothetical protein